MNFIEHVKGMRKRSEWSGVVDLLENGWSGALSVSEQAVLYRERGDALYKLGRVREAAIDFEQAYSLVSHVDNDDDKAWIYNSHALSLGQRAAHNSAAAVISEALMMLRHSEASLGFLRWNLGWQWYKSGYKKQGYEAMEMAYSIMERNGDESRFCLAVDMSCCLITESRYDEAYIWLKRVESIYPSRRAHRKASWDSRMSLCLAHQGRLSEAQELVCRASEYAESAHHKAEQAFAAICATQIAKMSGGEYEELRSRAIALSIMAGDGRLLSYAVG